MDILEQLRAPVRRGGQNSEDAYEVYDELGFEAADEIERLTRRAELAETEREALAASHKDLAGRLARMGEDNERLRAALEPFAVVGRPLVSACASGAIPPGASAKFLKLVPLTAQDFVNAAKALTDEQEQQENG